MILQKYVLKGFQVVLARRKDEFFSAFDVHLQKVELMVFQELVYIKRFYINEIYIPGIGRPASICAFGSEF